MMRVSLYNKTLRFFKSIARQENSPDGSTPTDDEIEESSRTSDVRFH